MKLVSRVLLVLATTRMAVEAPNSANAGPPIDSHGSQTAALRIQLTPVRINKEMWGGGTGWSATALEPLRADGGASSGLVRYRTLFIWHGERQLLLTPYRPDPMLVAVNGTPAEIVPSADGAMRVDLARVAKPGINRIEVLYDCGDGMRQRELAPEHKGLKSAVLLADMQNGTALSEWRYNPGWPTQFGANSLQAAEAQPGFDDTGWKRIRTGDVIDIPGYRGWIWCRSTLNVSPADISQGRTTLYFDGVIGSAIVYVNGQRVVDHTASTHEPEAFSVELNGKLPAGPNTVAVEVRSDNGHAGITKAVTLNSAEIGQPLKGWEICERLEGQRMGYANADAPGPVWMKAILPEGRAQRTNTVRWYRTSFRLPISGGAQPSDALTLKLDAGGEALVYVNGTMIGRYSDRRSSVDFSIPVSRVFFGKRPNIVALAIWDGGQAASVRSIEVTRVGQVTL